MITHQIHSTSLHVLFQTMIFYSSKRTSCIKDVSINIPQIQNIFMIKISVWYFNQLISSFHTLSTYFINRTLIQIISMIAPFIQELINSRSISYYIYPTFDKNILRWINPSFTFSFQPRSDFHKLRVRFHRFIFMTSRSFTYFRSTSSDFIHSNKIFLLDPEVDFILRMDFEFF